jgi:nicotinamidase-related amidase
MKKLLLIIDPQNDFVDSRGSLYVPGAEKGIDAIVKFIKENGQDIDDIAITQDTHKKYHIAHPAFWYPRPEPFTQISAEDYRDGVYSAIMYPSKEDKPYDPFILQYLESLPGPLTIWPEHCLSGSWGWAFPDNLVDAVHDWEIQPRLRSFKIYQKGMWSNMEAFSLFTPTFLDYRPYADIDVFEKYDEIIVCGFAKDVCVANTVKDMLDSGLYDGKLKIFEEGMASIDVNSPMNAVFSGLQTI